MVSHVPSSCRPDTYPDIRERLEIPGFLRDEKKLHITGPFPSEDLAQLSNRNKNRANLNINRTTKFFTGYAGKESEDRETCLVDVIESFKIFKGLVPNSGMVIITPKMDNIKIEEEFIRVAECLPNLTEHTSISDLVIAPGGHVLSIEAGALSVPSTTIPV